MSLADRLGYPENAGEYSHGTRVGVTIVTVAVAAAIAPVAVQGYTSAMVADGIRAVASGVVFLLLYRAGLALVFGRPQGIVEGLQVETTAIAIGRTAAAIGVWIALWVFPLAAVGTGLVELAQTVWLDSILVVGPLWAIDRGIWALRR